MFRQLFCKREKGFFPPFSQLGRWEAKTTESVCWGGIAPQCWCYVWAPVPILSHEEVLDVGGHSSSHLVLHTFIHRLWCKIHSHITNLSSQTVESQISSGMSRGNTHPRTGYQSCTQMKEHWFGFSNRFFLITGFQKHMLFVKYILRSSRQVLDYWTYLLIKDSCFQHFFSLGSPCILYQWRSGLLVHLNLLTISLLSSVTPPQYWNSQIHRNWQPLLKAKLTVIFF